MPGADYRATVIGAESGHARLNNSWIIGRLLRDFEQRAAPLERDKSSRNWESLRVSVFKVIPGTKPGRPTHDFVWYSGYGIILIQLGIAIVPLCLHAAWVNLVIVVCGTLLALSQGAISQWREEKWECPKRGGRTVTITQGNGSRQAMVILGSENALELEILAHCDGNLASTLLTRVISGIQALLWMMLLITVAGLKQGSWCKRLSTHLPSEHPLTTTNHRPTRHRHDRHAPEHLRSGESAQTERLWRTHRTHHNHQRQESIESAGQARGEVPPSWLFTIARLLPRRVPSATGRKSVLEGGEQTSARGYQGNLRDSVGCGPEDQ